MDSATQDKFTSAETVEWATPWWLYDILNRRFRFTLDPFATAENAKCFKFFTREQDSLQQSWAQEVVFANPPYGNPVFPCKAKCKKKICARRGFHDLVYQAGALDCIRKGIAERSNKCTSVWLMPSRTDTIWFAEAFAASEHVIFFKGRIAFGEGLAPALFPSVLFLMKSPNVYSPRVSLWAPEKEPFPG